MVAQIIPARDILIYDRPLFQGQIIIDSERSAGTWWMGRFREDPEFMTPLHVHHHADEQFYVLDGVLSVYINGAWHDLAAGELALAPRRTPHAQGNTSAQPVHFLGSGNPAGFEGFFPAIEALVNRLTPSDPQFPAELAKISAQFDTEFLGPAPPHP
jgi:mannose-6-phosphate isomerase-like protein (cupin superfamily)